MALTTGDNRKKNQSMDTALEAWGKNIPTLVKRLAERCDETSQKHVASMIGKSTAAVSCVLSKSYKGDLNAVLTAFESWDSGLMITCPMQGEISQGVCERTQNSKINAASTLGMKQWRACQKCKFNNGR